MPSQRKYSSNADRQRAYRERRKRDTEAAVAMELSRKGIPGPPALTTVPGRSRWIALLGQVQASLETIQQEIEAYINDRSEAWQESERGVELQERLDQVAEALQAVEGIEF